MTGNAIKSEALELRKLSSEELDAVSGGWFCFGVVPSAPLDDRICPFGQDKTVEFCMIMREMTQGG